jgi:hypothetical protein
MEPKRLRQPDTTAPSPDITPLSARQRAIGKGLQKLFDDVVGEAVPDDLLQILEQADERQDERETGE